MVLLLILSYASGYGQSDESRKKEFNVKRGVGLEGYDPVSYFDNRPEEGKESLRYAYRGITYQFISQANLDRFKSQPDKFEPAYGGWCAYAMGKTGEKVKVDPETYKILNGKLFLFYNFWGNNTLSDWNKDEQRLKTMGDANWQKIVH